MNPSRTKFSKTYGAALIARLKEGGARAGFESARGLGDEASAAGIEMLDFAKLHEAILIDEILPTYPARRRPAIIKQAGRFFAAAIMPLDPVSLTHQKAGTQLKKSIAALSHRTVELAASNHELTREIARRKEVEEALKKSQRLSMRRLQQLRKLSRQLLSAQEEERKIISRELHDVIAPTLTSIGIHLDTLKKKSAADDVAFDEDLEFTRRLVGESIEIVQQFARELRPAVLDVLGLIPALHSFMKDFTATTGIRTSLKAFAEVEQLTIAKKTALFRVTQEAMHNAARHANASRIEVGIEKASTAVRLKISDDGPSFDVQRALQSGGMKHLGLLGMRERLEMVGGTFDVHSLPASGTTILATIPLFSVRKSFIVSDPL